MIQKLFPLILFIIILFNSSCSRYYYSPDDGHLLTLSEKKDFHFSASANSLRFRDTANHFNFQLGYSPIKHLAIQGSFFYLKDGEDNPIITGEGHMYSGAIGTYKFFEPFADSFLKKLARRKGSKKKPLSPPVFFQENYSKKGTIVDLYLGHARGLSRIDYDSRGRSFTRFQKTFGQIGLHLNNSLGGFSYTFKVGQLRFNEATSSGIVNLDDLNKLRSLEDNNTFPFREHSFRFFTGVRQLKVFFNLTLLYDSRRLSTLGVDNNNFTIGILVDIDECFKKTKSSLD